MPEQGCKPKRYDPAKAAVRGIVKQSRIKINNDNDELCCARAIVTMRAWADEKDNRFPTVSYRTLRSNSKTQKRIAQQLLNEAGVDEGPCGLPELAKFQAVLPDYQIKVFKVGRPHMLVYAGPESSTNRRILLLLEDGHFDGCTSYAAFFNTSYYCHDCDRGYNKEDVANHPCDGVFCRSCFTRGCAEYLQLKQALAVGEYPKPTLHCFECNRFFIGPICLQKHAVRERGKRSTCQNLKKCKDCCKTYEVKVGINGRGQERHKCGWAECKVCEKRVDIYQHQCFIQPVSEKEDEPKTKKVPVAEVGTRAMIGEPENGMVLVERDPPLFVYADYEAVTDGQGVQTPILIGYETNESEECQLYYGNDCTERFIADMETLTVDSEGDDRNVIIIFHKLKGYDGMFLLKYMYAHHRDVERLVTVGVKVLSFTSDRLTFKDSLCFLPFSLAAFPSTFGLTELRKGFFPHLFNMTANQAYEGPLPETRYYDPEGMSPKKRQEFERWHAGLVADGYIFNLRNDMEAYCESDVKLLKAGCQQFVEEFKREADFDPMEKCITTASACNRYWRKCHLPKRSVAVQPPSGWKGAQTNQSFQARQWLAWRNHQLRQDVTAPDRIRHVDNGGEVRLSGMLVDGFDATSRSVYEYNGCFYHGCPRCFPNKRGRGYVSQLRGDRTLQQCYEATLAKKQKLEAEGFNVVTRWECDWLREAKTNEVLKTFLDNRHAVTPLQPRDAFSGGRTNAVRLHHHVTEGETIRYQDVRSLYPWVNKYADYAVSHPKIITDVDHTDISQYFGLAKVTILPPENLLHPVLPWRSCGKLTFPLSRTCVENEMPKSLLERSYVCPHTDSQRELTGTWCTPEILEAVAQNYVIRRIHEVWHFPPQQRRKGLFASYVDTWLKIKTESSGYPHWATTPEDKERFIQRYHEREGVSLIPDKIAKNPGRKATAKLMLNSFWGKFGENLRKSRVQAVSNPAQLYEVVSGQDRDIHPHLQ